MPYSNRMGFTLLELSILLVIVALVLGGILFGQDLILAAKMRKLHSQYTSFMSAARAFETKYNCLPGDCDHATQFFAATPEGCYYPAATSDGNTAVFDYAKEATACDGDGNGRIDVDNMGNQTSVEGLGAWQHLANSGLIGGIYSGSYSSATSSTFLANYNCPPSVTDNVCWTLWDGDYLTASGTFSGMTDSAGHLGAVFWLFPTAPGYFDSGFAGAGFHIFTPVQALAYDTKFDDGHPDSGQVLAVGDMLAAGCTTPGTGPPDANGFATGPFSYDIQQTGLNCGLVLRAGF